MSQNSESTSSTDILPVRKTESAPFERSSTQDKYTTDILTVFVGILALLAILAAFYVAGEILLPICVALILNLLLRPAVRFLHRLKFPHALAALVILVVMISGFATLGTALSGPATEWCEKLPNALPKLQERLQFLIRPVHSIQETVNEAENATVDKNAKTVNVAVQGAGLSDKLFTSTRVLLGGIFETFLVLFFLLLSGDAFQKKFIEILPRFQDKKKAFQISNQIEQDISAYLVTITIMNFLVGGAAALIMHFCGVGDAILWGTVAFFLNFVPILGPLSATCIFVVAGMLVKDSLAAAFLPAGLYFCVHLLEGEIITPLLVSKRFVLNPTLVILMLIFWYWMWGVPGAILATPMLAALKIICDNNARLKNFGHLMEG